MRTQDQNPAYERFGHLLPETGLYPARFVDIFWDRDDDYKIEHVEVVFIPRGSNELRSVANDKDFWQIYADYNRGWDSDLGNSSDDWLKNNGLTPESIFGQMLESGFSNKAELKQALDEFAHIEECNWARLMLKGFQES
jgi:hypothetical protein